jgi:hypothetical protein
MLKVFISYSHKDRDLLFELNAQLATLRNLALIEQWTDNELQTGMEWEPDIWSHFNSADILILLISADFLASYYCYKKEFEAALQRAQRKEMRLLPVIVRDCDWKDGRLDLLQCMCADKPVALYGDRAINRDPAWTLVVTEIRKVVTQLASAPRSTSAGPGDDEDSEGDLVPLLCNRQSQEELLFEKFIGAAPGAPQIYFLPGAQDAVHSSFVERVQYEILPRLLGEESESFRHLTQSICAEWAQKPPSGKELGYLTAKMAWQIDARLKADAGLIKKHPRIARGVVIIQHRLYAKHWNDKTPGLLRDYVAFWSKAADDKDRPLFLIFFHVIFEDGAPAEVPPAESPPLAALAELAAELDGKPCTVAVFEPLGGVEWHHVNDWLASYFPRRASQDRPLRKLFREKPVLPMREVELALRAFAG